MTSLSLFDDNPYQSSCQSVITEVRGQAICLNQTIFYPLGGGQDGDTGTMILGDRVYIISDTRWDLDNEILHIMEEQPSADMIGVQVELVLDWDRRYRLMRLHTTLHLASALVQCPVTGAKVTVSKAHIDFDMGDDKIDKLQLMESLNALVKERLAVSTEDVPLSMVAERSDFSRAMEAEPPVRKDMVRFVSIGQTENPVDFQACGGTHVRNTAEIGPLLVYKIDNKGKRNRRVTIVLA